MTWPLENRYTAGLLNVARMNFGMITKGSKVLAIGGITSKYDDSNKMVLKSIEEWDPDNEQWTMSKMELALPRSGFGIAYVPYSNACSIGKDND